MVKLNPHKKGITLFLLLAFVAVIFIIVSINILFSVSKLRHGIESNVRSIGVISQIESKAFDFISGKSEIKSEDFKSDIEDLLSKTEDKYLFVIKSFVGDINTIKIRASLELKAIELTVLCKEVIRKKRNILSVSSTELSAYWLYLYFLISTACLLVLILAFIGYKIFKAKEEVFQLKSQNSLLLNNSIDSVMSCDLNGSVLELNKATENMFGYSREEILKSNVELLYGSKTEQHKVQTSIIKTGSFSGEIMNMHKSGRIFHSYLSANLLYDADGEKIGVMGISRDISTQKELEDQFQMIVRNASDIIFTTDDKWKITYINEAAVRLFEYDINDLVGMSISKLVVPDNMGRVAEFYKKQFKEGIEETYLELQIVTRTGKQIWVGQNVRIVYDISDKNKIIGFNGIQRNINERKQAELKLEVSESNFRLISGTINDVFFLYNLNTDKYEYVSSNCSKILGVTQDYFYRGSKYVNDYVVPEDKKIVMNAFNQLSNGEPYDIEFRILIDNNIHWVNECAFPIFDDEGKVIKNSGTCRDITESVLAKSIIDKQNVEIAESIQYSKIILDSTLPTEDEIFEILPESFVFSKPKSIISGDFYIVDTVELENGLSYKIFIVGDCTGHGVPGGILSILCSSLLKDSLTNYYVKSPADALNLVREKLIKFFRSSQSRTVREGMDIAFCALNERDNILHYAGAKNSCILIRDNELFEYKGDAQHVGYSSNKMPFTLNEIEVKEGDSIYLYSDGYMDQFGGPRNKKFMKKRFRELLFSLHHLPIQEQHTQIDQILKDWQGDTEQTDDITILGVRLTATRKTKVVAETEIG
ncbi:MAG: PAS domain S-box protein [Crocinitomicaceae bacterium]